MTTDATSAGAPPEPGRRLPLLRNVALALLALYATMAGLLYAFERTLLYPATADPAPAPPAGALAEAVETADGLRLLAWHRPARAGRPTVLFFSGQAASLRATELWLRPITRDGTGLFIATYRGYDGNPGAPSEDAIKADALAAHDRLAALAPERILIAGWSLGSGVAAHVAAEREADGLVLLAPYSSTVQVAADRFPFAPVRLLMRDRYDTLALLPRIRAPIVAVAGARDTVIPPEHARRLSDAHEGPFDLRILPEAGHRIPASAVADALASPLLAPSRTDPAQPAP